MVQLNLEWTTHTSLAAAYAFMLKISQVNASSYTVAHAGFAVSSVFFVAVAALISQDKDGYEFLYLGYLLDLY
jgi:hypothetical protein